MSEKDSQITLKASYEGQEFIDGELVSALSLQELDEEGKAGKLLTAYDYTLTFDIIDAILIRNVQGDGRPSYETTKENNQPLSTSYSELISTKLIHTTEAFWGAKKLSLLGSSEPLEDEHMHLRIGLFTKRSLRNCLKESYWNRWSNARWSPSYWRRCGFQWLHWPSCWQCCGIKRW